MEVSSNWVDTFRLVLRQVIEPQPQPTILGRWAKEGHQHMSKYGSRDGVTVISDVEYKKMTKEDNQRYAPVEFCEKSKHIMGYQVIERTETKKDKDTIESVIHNSLR